MRPSLYTLPFGQDLCSATVDAIFDRIGSDPLALSGALIFLPNNRAIKSMTEAFVRRAQPGLLLPRLVAVGDLALDEALGPLIDPLNTAEIINPVIAPMQRLMLLTQLVAKYRAASGNPVNSNEGLRLARYLGEVIDELEIEEKSIADIQQPDEADLAGHWQSAYSQLTAMIPEYYAALEHMQRLGSATRRNRLLNQLTASFIRTPPSGLVVAAGISTAAPAIARLLRCIAFLPQSMVILPSIDLDMGNEDWDELGPHAAVEGELKQRAHHENHPQFHLKLLLERMNVSREEVQRIGSKSKSTSETIADIFCLPDATERWLDLPSIRKKLPHVRLMVTEDSAEEARAVAVILRQSLENPEQRMALVTPDRELAVRVAAQLQRWHIDVDDSAGTPLLQTPQGMLIMALANALADRFSPVSVLAIAKHPLVHSGEERLTWLAHARELDIVLRGPSSGLGLNAIRDSIARWLNEERNETLAVKFSVTEFWDGLSGVLSILETAQSHSFSDVMTALQNVATSLTQGGIWKGVIGRQLATFFEDLAGCDTSAIGKAEHEAIPAILTELMSGQVVRPPYGGHPRVAIYGLLEARLQQADLVICAGLNEGTWPQLPQPDPWLAPRIRRHLRLAALERNIGLSAHDLATALGAKDVILSRTKRDRSGPTVASRFLLRIQALLGNALIEEHNAIALARMIDASDPVESFAKPEAMPSADQRKVGLSVTDFDQLKADPFSFYAKKILRLGVMESVDAEPGHAWRGTLIHDILRDWAIDDKCAPEKLMERAEALLSNPALHPALRVLWQPRIAEGLRWIAQETQRLQVEEGRHLLVAEEPGKITLEGITIKGRADRIDKLSDGTLAIIDYKSGQPPKGTQVYAGFAMQLGLIGLMAERGCIKNVSGEASAFEYWSLAKNKSKFGYIKSVTKSEASDKVRATEDFVAFVEGQAIEALRKWITGNEPFSAKLHPEFPTYADYDQFMRLQEWNGREPLRDESAP